MPVAGKRTSREMARGVVALAVAAGALMGAGSSWATQIRLSMSTTWV
jgi:hypothetical protein